MVPTDGSEGSGASPRRDAPGASGPPPSRPPDRWRGLLLRALRGDRPEMVAELDELYARRHEREGRAAADRWYRREVIGFLTLVPLAAWGRRAVGWWSGEGLMGGWWKDVRRAARSLLRAPGLTATAVATLTLGIGANTVIFSVVDHVVLRPLPYAQPERLVSVWTGTLRREVSIVRDHNRTLERVGGYLQMEGFNLETTDGGVRVDGMVMDEEVMPLLGVQPALGRSFRAEEMEEGRNGVALIGHSLWLDRFGGDPGVVGRTIRVDGTTREVVGVLPAGYAFPAAGIDVALPMVRDPSNANLMWGWGGHRIVARMLPGVTPTQVKEDLAGAAERSRTENPFWTPPADFRADAPVTLLQESVVGDARPALLILLGAVGLVLLVACANVANLLLARGLARGREVAVRTALGASRGRIVREHLIESLLLAAVGSVVALVAARWVLDATVAFLPPEIPRAGEITLDARIVGAGVALALLAGLLAGLLPALKGSKADPALALREGGRGGSASSGRRRLTSAMVVAQMAVAVVLVVGAGLLVRSLSELNSVDPGFDTAGLTSARLSLVGSYDDDASRAAFLERVSERLRATPGIEAASVGSRVPFGEGWEGWAMFIDGVTEDPNSLPVVERYRVLPGFLETLGVRLLAGRLPDRSDGPDSRDVAVVDETMAERFWPGEDAVGRIIRYPWRGAGPIEVIGVVSGVHHGDLSGPREATFYVPLAQAPPTDATVLVKGSPDLALGAVVREVVREVDGRVPVSSVAEMDDLIASSLARSRWMAVLLGLFALTTLLLGSIGVYGVVAYSVRQRTREIGVRVALGAEPGRIRTSVLTEGLRLTVPGLLLGLALAIPAAGVLEGVLFGVRVLDPVTFAAVPAVLLATGLLAVYVPALRATRVQPVEALRSEG